MKRLHEILKKIQPVQDNPIVLGHIKRLLVKIFDDENPFVLDDSCFVLLGNLNTSVGRS